MSETAARGFVRLFDPKEAKRLWRSEERAVADNTVCIGLAGSFTLDTLVPFLGAHLIANQLPVAIKLAPYNQLIQTCLDPMGAFGEECGVIALLWRLEDLMHEEIAAFLRGDSSGLPNAKIKLASLVGAIIRLRENFSGMIVASVPPFPVGISASASSLDNANTLGAFHRTLASRFVEQLAAFDGVHLADFDAVQRKVGLAHSYDPRQWHLYHAPFAAAFLLEAGTMLGRMIMASRRVAKKCVVLDCDNTLWGGVIGEDGLDGIQIGEDFPGSAYRDLQRLVLHWRSQGVLVALVSKNNESDVWEVFDRHDAMVLKREHISAWQINWRPKAENIPLIAKALNIGLDSLVFIDDSAMEIGYMQAAQPEVTSIQLPEETADILGAFQELTLFDRLEITDEDRKRAEMMRAEQDREALGTKISHGDFLNALELRIDLFRARTEDLGRITQLINKTNQFNLTTIRRTLDEVRELAASPELRVYGLHVQDKFGEYGLTGVIIARISTDRQRWTIDTLLLSCRVLGRGVETGLIGALADDARASGATEILASFIPTRKNELCASFLPDHGFVRVSEQQWGLALNDAPAIPEHVTRLEMRSAPAVAAA